MEPFLVDYQDGQFFEPISRQISPFTWCEISYIGCQGNPSYKFRLLRFEKPHISIKENFTALVYVNQSQQEIKEVEATIIDTDDNKSYGVKYRNDRPFFNNYVYTIKDVIISFLNRIYLFDTAEDAATVINTESVFNYTVPEKLKVQIKKISQILSKYPKLPEELKTKMVKWISDALLKFGYQTEKLDQKDDEFKETVSLLNSQGYFVSKSSFKNP